MAALSRVVMAARRDSPPGAASAAGDAAPPPAGKAPRSWVSWLWWAAFTAMLLAIVLPPAVRLLSTTVEGGAETFARLRSVPRIGDTLWNTVVLGLGAAGVAVVLGTFLAWCSSMVPPKVRPLVAALPFLPLLVPMVAFVTGWAFLLSPTSGLLNQVLRGLPVFRNLTSGPLDVYSTSGIVLITGLSLTSFVYLFVYSAIRSSGGMFEAAAAVSGASRGRAFFTVTLPLLRPSIVSSAGIVFLLGLGQFSAPLLLGQRQGFEVISTEIYQLREAFPVDFALGAMLGVPILLAGIASVFLQRYLTRNDKRFVVQSGRASGVSGYTSPWAAVPVVAYGLVFVVLPLLALLVVAITPYWSGEVSVDEFTFEHFARAWFYDNRTVAAITNSVVASAVATLIVLPIGFFAALAMRPAFGVGGLTKATVDVVAQIPLAIPASILGFGLLLAYSQPPLLLYGTQAVLVLTYVTLMIPYAMRSQLTSLIRFGDSYIEAATVSGAAMPRVLLGIVMPLARKGIASGAAIIVVLLFHEFTASLMVRSSRMDVMATVLYDYWVNGTSGVVAVMALTMVLATGLGAGLALLLGGKNLVDRP